MSTFPFIGVSGSSDYGFKDMKNGINIFELFLKYSKDKSSGIIPQCCSIARDRVADNRTGLGS